MEILERCRLMYSKNSDFPTGRLKTSRYSAINEYINLRLRHSMEWFKIYARNTVYNACKDFITYNEDKILIEYLGIGLYDDDDNDDDFFIGNYEEFTGYDDSDYDNTFGDE